eukprot:NODE_3846_length_517_cov_34.730769_g3276_i0.p3 GENE.NODE_3846_length_517_cov_34.730769_g3276_i0~~NODE_3846_length_517_cov_34.730769_g3276_i0.p3  ORF type:complete len:67 (-),score=13.70 NODE_3846_length_517_cov_34.730769_g3276_i0:140-340(-)
MPGGVTSDRQWRLWGSQIQHAPLPTATNQLFTNFDSTFLPPPTPNKWSHVMWLTPPPLICCLVNQF